MQRFDIVFEGKIDPSTTIEAVQVRLAALFKSDCEAVAKLFSGRRYILKKDLDRDTADKYQAALRKAGALCELVAREPAQEETAPAATSLAPPGTVLVDQVRAEAPDIDISSLSMAQPGEDILDDYSPPAPPEMDLSGMSMAAPGEILDSTPPHEVPALPTAEFSVAEVGSLLSNPAPAVGATELRTDHFHLVPDDDLKTE